MALANSPKGAPFCVLLIQPETAHRKVLRVELEKAGGHVIAVDSGAEALVRLRWRRYDLVIFSGRVDRPPAAEDFEILVDRSGLLSTEGGYALYAPCAGVRAAAVLVVSSVDPSSVAASMQAVRSRVIQMGAATVAD
jgi:hypothetical protein